MSQRFKNDLAFIGGLLLIGTLVTMCSGCAGKTTLDISIGPQINPVVGGGSNWLGDGPIVDVAIRHQRDNWFFQYAHTSNMFSGVPFNSERESTVDRVTVGRSFRLFGRD